KYQPVSLEALRNVQRCEIWFSRPERFNDPFDCACRLDRAPTSEDEYQQLFERQLAKLRPADRENYKKHYLEAEKNPEAAKAKRRFRDFVDSVSTSSLEAWRREARGVACFSEL